MKILFIGDIVGRIGRATVETLLSTLRKEYQPDLVIANGENAAAGFGLTKKVYDQLIEDIGIDYLTSGNHVWDKKEFIKDFARCEKIIRPLNYPKCQNGVGYKIVELQGVRLAIVNVMGRTFMNIALDCPFQATDKLLNEIKDQADLIFIDIHAEVTSEKQAYAYHYDGEVAAIVGTHTHVQTADERILPAGTAYISDVGYVGARDSVLGMNTREAVARFIYGTKEHFSVPKEGPTILNAVFLELDPAKKRAIKIERVVRKYEMNSHG